MRKRPWESERLKGFAEGLAEAIWIRVSIVLVPALPDRSSTNKSVGLVPDRPGRLPAILTEKMLKTSLLLDLPGRRQSQLWCPEEDSNLHALSSAAT